MPSSGGWWNGRRCEWRCGCFPNGCAVRLRGADGHRVGHPAYTCCGPDALIGRAVERSAVRMAVERSAVRTAVRVFSERMCGAFARCGRAPGGAPGQQCRPDALIGRAVERSTWMVVSHGRKSSLGFNGWKNYSRFSVDGIAVEQKWAADLEKDPP